LNKTIRKSKIQVPSVSRNFVVRRRLIDQLGMEDNQLVLLQAAVGYGKTVLLTQYIKTLETRYAWFRLDETDNDAESFLEYLTVALESAAECNLLDLANRCRLTNKHDRQSLVRDMMDTLNDMLDWSGRQLVLVLDDFQAVSEPEIYALLDAFLSACGANIRVFIATKGALPLFLVNHLLAGKGEIISQQELCFTTEEAAEILACETMDASVRGIAEDIRNAVEGWPAGIMFAALYFRRIGRSGLSGNLLITGLKAVNDYFMQEVFVKLPCSIQRFLTATSVLEPMSVEACSAIMQTESAKSILEYLVKENLFITKLSPTSDTYRYHALFREFLLEQLKDDDRTGVLISAARYYLRSPDKARAVDYAMQAGDIGLMQQALESIDFERPQQWHAETLENWFQWLDRRNTSLSQKNMLLRSCMLRQRGDFEEAMRLTGKALEMAQDTGDEAGCLHALLEKAKLVRNIASPEESNTILEDVVRRADKEDRDVYFGAVLEQLYNMLFLASFGPALELCRKTLARALRLGNKKAVERLSWFSIWILFYMGDYEQALQCYEELGAVSPTYIRGFMPEACISLIYLFRGESAKALDIVSGVLSGVGSGSLPEDLWLALLFRALIFWRTGERRACEKDLSTVEKLAERWEPDHVFARYFRAVRDAAKLSWAEPFQSGEKLEEPDDSLHPFPRSVLVCSGVEYCSRVCLLDQALETGSRYLAGLVWESGFSELIRRQLDDIGSRQQPADSADSPEAFDGRVSVECFGGFRMYLPGDAVPMKWRTKKAQYLCAYLFHQKGRIVDREKLVAHLWPETDRNQATALLNTTLYSIRKELVKRGVEQLLVYKSKGYYMNMTLVRSDLDELERTEFICANHGALGQTGDIWLRCCDGSYMEGIEDEVYLESRAWHERRCLKLCRDIGTEAEKQGSYESARMIYAKAIVLDPFGEAFYTAIIRCCGVLGDVKGALSYYEKLRETLRQELDSEPDAEVEQVLKRSLRMGHRLSRDEENA
jgi:pentatricopeptide repeat protein